MDIDALDTLVIESTNVLAIFTNWVLEDAPRHVFTMQRLLGVTKVTSDRLITYCEEQVEKIGLMDIVFASNSDTRTCREVYVAAKLALSLTNCTDVVGEICNNIIRVYNGYLRHNKYARCIGHEYIIYIRWLSFRKLCDNNKHLESSVTHRLDQCCICKTRIGIIDYSYYDRNIDKYITYPSCCKEGCIIQCNYCGKDISNISLKPIMTCNDEYNIDYDWAFEIKCRNCGAQGSYNMESTNTNGNIVRASDENYIAIINKCVICNSTDDTINHSHVDDITNIVMDYPSCCLNGCIIQCRSCGVLNSVKLKPVLNDTSNGRDIYEWTYKFNCDHCGDYETFDINRQKYIEADDNSNLYIGDPNLPVVSDNCSVCDNDHYTVRGCSYYNHRAKKQYIVPCVCQERCRVKCGSCGVINIDVHPKERIKYSDETEVTYEWIYKINCGKCNVYLTNDNYDECDDSGPVY